MMNRIWPPTPDMRAHRDPRVDLAESMLNKVFRRQIGCCGSRTTGGQTLRCNEGAWVLLEDIPMV